MVAWLRRVLRLDPPLPDLPVRVVRCGRSGALEFFVGDACVARLRVPVAPDLGGVVGTSMPIDDTWHPSAPDDVP